MFIDSVERLHERLREYLEAVYHIADRGLLDQRRELLERDGVLRQPPFIESTRAYAKGETFDEILAHHHADVRGLAKKLSSRESPLLYDPPYEHQGLAIRALLDQRRHIVVYTGTGSGKTECFTVPTLLRLASEAAQTPDSFKQRAVRALVLYPMNALVNDQVGRIRRLLGDDDVAAFFERAGGRPATFGMYTGRTPFAGTRHFDAESDGKRIEAFADFYIKTVARPASDGVEDAMQLRKALEARGRWPSKPDLLAWYGKGEWSKRLHTAPHDRELIARHEFQGYTSPDGLRRGAPPDVLVTNYSMLEFMLLRPIERQIFEATARWLREHPTQTFYLVLDEAHLYRGAQGTEVALLIRRLLERLGLSGRSDQLRIAVTSASFSSEESARGFAAQLVGQDASGFLGLGGRLAIDEQGAAGDTAVAEALANTDLRAFYSTSAVSDRYAIVLPALRALAPKAAPMSVADEGELGRALHAALLDVPLRKRLVWQTQTAAVQIPDLAAALFPGAPDKVARDATEVLAALCASARLAPGEPNLLPSRIHSFHRGLPGLWACVNRRCGGSDAVIGKLFAQPRLRCDACDARVFELYTCRSCGAAYARGSCATVEIGAPTFVWPAIGADDETEVRAIDILLEPDRADLTLTVRAELDVRTGMVTTSTGDVRAVGFYRLDAKRDEPVGEDGWRFYRCGVCGDDNDRRPKAPARAPVRRRSPVEDHQTAGQDPFYAIVHEQLTQQPARTKRPAFLKRETPLAGRKVLIFSDGRQKAARLAAELGRAALRDSLRPLLLEGFQVKPTLSLAAAYTATLLGAAKLDVELRATDESFDVELGRAMEAARTALADELDEESMELLAQHVPPAPVATLLIRLIADKHTGLTALGLATFEPRTKALRSTITALPALPGVDPATNRSLIALWLAEFVEKNRVALPFEDMLEPQSKWLAAETSSGDMQGVRAALRAAGGDPAANTFRDGWLPALREAVKSQDDDAGAARVKLNGLQITLKSVDNGALGVWGRCVRCSRVQCAVLAGETCVHCLARGSVERLEPESEALRKFSARKGFYRGTANGAGGRTPRPLVSREHSAALTGVGGEAQSRAERHELAFQDITARSIDGMRSPIDVLSCTTTMEVGIDIGDLSGVALRNMPPGRANYQQRAGRAGRRGNAIATVVAYADQDGHNQHLFENPRKLIKDAVPDPTLNLENRRIAERHVNAYLLQAFLEHALGDSATGEQLASLFGSLGRVGDFLQASGRVSLTALREWMRDEHTVSRLRAAVDRWLPIEVRGRSEILDAIPELPARIARALRETAEALADQDEQDIDPESSGDPARSLLDRLLYEGVLPKYAFPTNLAAFHVFEVTNGLGQDAKTYRRKIRYAPQRALPLALSEYAPGRTVFIDGRLWMSSALFSPMQGAVDRAFADAQHYRSCAKCGYAVLSPDPTPTTADCPRCDDDGFGASPPRKWVQPPGFAHAMTFPPRTEPDADSYSRAGRAVLWSQSPPSDRWSPVGDRVGVRWHVGYAEDNEVVVTNEGPREKGFRVCSACGAIEPAIEARLLKEHRRPTPDARGYTEKCDTPIIETINLGTRFRTDVLLMRFELPVGQSLAAGTKVFQSTLSSLATALTQAASIVLEVEHGEVVAGYRPAPMAGPSDPSAVEIFLYDQLAGGAGYVVELSHRIGELLDATRATLSHEGWGGRTPPPPCDRACYGCLLSFKNSYEHGSLDRRLALDLLQAATTGTPATLGAERSRAAYADVVQWLRVTGATPRVGEPIEAGSSVIAPVAVDARGGGVVAPALAHPFSPDAPDDLALRGRLDWGAGGNVDVHPIDHLRITRALPAVMQEIRAKIT